MKRTHKVIRAKAIVQQPAAQIYDPFLANIQACIRVAEYRLLPYDLKTALPVIQQLKNIVTTSEPSDA